MNKPYQGLILISFLMSLSSFIFAQNCSYKLSIQIMDNDGNSLLPNSTLFCPELNRIIYPTKNSICAIDSLCHSDYHFIVICNGYDSLSKAIKLHSDTSIQFLLTKKSELLNELVIVDHSNNVINKKDNTLSKDQLIELKGKSFSDAISIISGVNVLKTGANVSKPIINGLSGTRISIYSDNIPHESQQWGNDHAPEIDLNMYDKLTVIKGPGAVKYGSQSIGGVIVLKNVEYTPDTSVHGNFAFAYQSNGNQWNFDNNLHFSSNLGNVKSTISLSQSGDKHTSKYFLTNTGTKSIAASLTFGNKNKNRVNRKLSISYFQNELGILKGSQIGNTTDLQLAINYKIPFFTSDTFSYHIQAPKQQVKHLFLSANWMKVINPLTTISIDGGWQLNNRKEFDVRRGGLTSTPSLSLLLFSQYYDLSLIKLFNNVTNRSLNLGLQYKYQNNTNNPETRILPLIPDYIAQIGSAYQIYTTSIYGYNLAFANRLEFRNYITANFSTNHGITKYSKRFFGNTISASIEKKISANIKTDFYINYTSRPPEIHELFSNGLHQGVSGIELGNSSLTHEKLFSISNDWNGKLSSRIGFSVSGFLQKFHNFIYLQPQQELRLTIRGAFPVFKYVGADVLMSGVNTSISLQPFHDNVIWTNSYNYISAKNLSSGFRLIQIPATEYKSSVRATFPLKSWINEITTSVELIYRSQVNNVDPKEDIVIPPNAYTLLSAFVKLKHRFRNSKEIQCNIRCENLLNISYRDYLNRQRYFSDEIGRNISININTYF